MRPTLLILLFALGAAANATAGDNCKAKTTCTSGKAAVAAADKSAECAAQPAPCAESAAAKAALAAECPSSAPSGEAKAKGAVAAAPVIIQTGAVPHRLAAAPAPRAVAFGGDKSLEQRVAELERKLSQRLTDEEPDAHGYLEPLDAPDVPEPIEPIRASFGWSSAEPHAPNAPQPVHEPHAPHAAHAAHAPHAPHDAHFGDKDVIVIDGKGATRKDLEKKIQKYLKEHEKSSKKSKKKNKNKQVYSFGGDGKSIVIEADGHEIDIEKILREHGISLEGDGLHNIGVDVKGLEDLHGGHGLVEIRTERGHGSGDVHEDVWVTDGHEGAQVIKIDGGKVRILGTPHGDFEVFTDEDGTTEVVGGDGKKIAIVRKQSGEVHVEHFGGQHGDKSKNVQVFRVHPETDGETIEVNVESIVGDEGENTFIIETKDGRTIELDGSHGGKHVKRYRLKPDSHGDGQNFFFETKSGEGQNVFFSGEGSGRAIFIDEDGEAHHIEMDGDFGWTGDHDAPHGGHGDEDYFFSDETSGHETDHGFGWTEHEAPHAHGQSGQANVELHRVHGEAVSEMKSLVNEMRQEIENLRRELRLLRREMGDLEGGTLR